MQCDELPLIHDYQPAMPILMSGGEAVSQQDFISRVSALSRRLPVSSCLINLCRDRYHFSLVFCASLLNGVVNLMPPNRQVQTLEAVAEDFPDCCAAVDDDLELPAMRVMDLRTELPHIESTGSVTVTEVPRLKSEQLAAIAFTSGTTGKPSPNPKQWRTLVGTAGMLASRLRARGERPAIVATVPSQHMYGLEMTLMMALHGGCTLDSGQPFYPDDIASALASLSGPRLLVTTPVHLRAMAGAGVKMPEASSVVSATAPLGRELAAEIEGIFQAPVKEIYGCTEAGSIATRQTCHEDHWTLLDGMTLVERSSPTGDAYYVQGTQLPDAARVDDSLDVIDQHRFHLLGRARDMINVGGKRASLADITLKLLAIDGVEDGIVFMTGEDAGKEDRQPGRPAALIVSRLPLQEIRATLARKIDPVFLPRPIRKVEALPRNDTGKVSIPLLQQLLKDA